MRESAEAKFQIEAWDEKPYEEMDGGPKLTRASVKKAFTGDIEGTSTVEYLMMHREDGTASFVGLERVVGKLNGRSGSFVLQHTGTFEAGTVKTTWSVVPSSGTDELAGIDGEGGFASAHASEYPMTFEYNFG